jgi:alpha 1,2-mannosyltransferase
MRRLRYATGLLVASLLCGMGLVLFHSACARFWRARLCHWRMDAAWLWPSVGLDHANRTTSAVALLYLAQSERLPELLRSLAAVEAYVPGAYPVVVFCEPQDRVRLRVALRHMARVRLEVVSAAFYDTPSRPVNDTSPHLLGYRRMCRFWAHGVFYEPVVMALEYYWRMDTDLYLRHPIPFDPFVWAAQRRLDYVYGGTSHDGPQVVEGLWAATLEHMRRARMHPRSLMPLARSTWGLATVPDLPVDAAIDLMLRAGYNRFIYYNNFELSRPSVWRTPAYRAYIAALDADGGIFRHRWGDAPIRTLAAHMLVPQRAQWTGLCYQHQGMVDTLF